MGKDDSSEPASKKFKQSQLCFKSPKANGSLKLKVTSPPKSENVCKSQKLHSSDLPKVTNDHFELESSSIPSNSDRSQERIVDNAPSLSENKENVSGSTNVPESAKEIPSEDITKGKDECVPMDVDCPSDVTSETEKPLKDDENVKQTIVDKPSEEIENNRRKSDVDNVSQSVKDNSVTSSLQKDEDSKEAASESASDIASPPRADKSALTDVSITSANESLSPKSVESISSNSEDESGATSSSSAPVTPKTPKRQMTPKMAKKHEESVKKKQLQQKLKAEKQAKKEELKNERVKMKKEEEEKKKQMKEERQKKRLAELELKNEEKRQKKEKKEKEDEEKRLKNEQKAEEIRKEEEKKEQEKKKKERAQAAFVSFFKKQPSSGGSPAATSSTDTFTVSSESPAFMPFPVKNDMRLAAPVRRLLSKSEKQDLDSVLDCKVETNTYLQVLKKLNYTPRTSLSTWVAPVSEELHDCIVIEAQVEDQGEENVDQEGRSSDEVSDSKHTKTTRRAKLLQFCENRRPAYFGTWTKRSKLVSGRTPFAKDSEGVLDYELDSDSEWEEEEEGEDLESVKDDDNEGQEEELEEGENGYLLDNTFVPHGYLSDEEQPDEEDIHESVEKQKDRLVALKEEFDEEMKQGGAQALKPKLLGCLWVSNSTTLVSKGSLYEVLLSHRAVWDESNCPMGINMEPDPTPVVEKSPTQTPPSKQLPAIVLQEIASMVDGSRWPLSRLVREITDVLSLARPQNPVSRLALTRAIKQIAVKTLDANGKSAWTIKPEYRLEYKLQDLEEVPVQVTPTSSRVKIKDTLLDNFLKGGQQKFDRVQIGPSAKKRISLTPVIQSPPVEKMEVTPAEKKVVPEVKPVVKKRVSFITLPPRSPGSTPQNRSLPRTPGPWPSSEEKQSSKPHVDTPRPPINKFLNKVSPTQPQDPIVISDDTNQ